MEKRYTTETGLPIASRVDAPIRPPSLRADVGVRLFQALIPSFVLMVMVLGLLTLTVGVNPIIVVCGEVLAVCFLVFWFRPQQDTIFRHEEAYHPGQVVSPGQAPILAVGGGGMSDTERTRMLFHWFILHSFAVGSCGEKQNIGKRTIFGDFLSEADYKRFKQAMLDERIAGVRGDAPNAGWRILSDNVEEVIQRMDV